MIRASAVAPWAPKSLDRDHEWMDAAAASEARQLFAIADGATNDSFASHRWARALTDDFVRSQDAARDFSEWLRAVATRWQRLRSSYDHPLDQESFDAGSFATFLGVEVDAKRMQWRAIAVGDACLFQTRDDRLVRAWPLTHAAAFTTRPDLVPSVLRQFRPETVRRAEGDLREGDALLLATDELARWALWRPADAAPWEFLRTVRNGGLRQAVSDLRAAGEMEADDITLMQVRIEAIPTEGDGQGPSNTVQSRRRIEGRQGL